MKNMHCRCVYTDYHYVYIPRIICSMLYMYTTKCRKNQVNIDLIHARCCHWRKRSLTTWIKVDSLCYNKPGGGGGVPLGVENLTLSQCVRCTKNTPCHNYTLLKICIYAYPVAILHRRWCPDRGPVINIVGWEPLGSNPVINGVACQ